MISKRVLSRVLLISLSVVLLWKGIVPGFQEVQSDFPNYYVSSKLLLEGNHVSKFYDDEWFLTEANNINLPFAKFSPFPPPTAVLMVPLARFSPLVAKQIWTIFNLFVLIGLIWNIYKVTDWKIEYCGLIVLLTGFGLINNFYLGQFYLILTFLIFLGYHFANQNKKLWAGLFFAVGVIFKYFPIVYLIGYLVNGKNKLVAYAIALGLMLAIGMFTIIGFETIPVFVNQALIPHLNGAISGQDPSSIAFQSYSSFFLNIFKSEILAKSSSWLIYLMVLSSTIYAIFIIKRNKWHNNYVLAVIGFGAMVILPASASYHFLLLIFPTVLFVHQFKLDNEGWSSKYLMLIYTGVGFINAGFTKSFWSSDSIILKIVSYPRLWLITALFVYVIFSLFQMRKRVKTRIINSFEKYEIS